MRYEHITSKEEQKMHKEFCQENKIPKKYYYDRNAVPVDFSQIDEFVQTYPTKLSARDLMRVRERITVDSKLLEELYFKDIVKKIVRKLSPIAKKIFRLMLTERNQTEIAERLHITSRTVRRHVKKIRTIAKKMLKMCPK